MKAFLKAFLFLALLAAAIVYAVYTNGIKDLTKKEIAIINTLPDSILHVYTIENENETNVLREESTELSEEDLFSPEYELLAERMIKTVTHPSVDGVGLAAPQIGINRKIVAVQRFDKPGKPFEVYPNISIVSYSDSTIVSKEGCLSVPNQRHPVERAAKVKIQYFSLEKKQNVSEEIEGFTAVIFQHEVDHLNGILYIDKVEQ